MTDSTLRAPSAEARGAPWPRDFTLLWRGTAVSQFGAANAALAGPLLALALTGSPVLAGWVTACGTLPRIALLLPAGVLVDRWDRRRVMIGSQLARIAAIVLLLGAVLLLDASPWLIAVCAAVQGACTTFYTTAETAVVPALVEPDRLPRAIGRNETRLHAAEMAGRSGGGLLFGLGHGLPSLADIASALTAVVMLLRMRGRTPRPARAVPARFGDLVHDLGEGFGHLWGDRLLRRVLAVCTVTNFFFQSLPLLLLFLGRERHLPGVVVGLLCAASGLGGLVGASVASRAGRRVRPTRLVLGCVWAWALLTAGLALAGAVSSGLLLTALPLASGCIGFVGAHLNVALGVYQATAVSPGVLGRVTSANRFFTGGAVPLGAMFSGYLVTSEGLRQVPAIVAVVVGTLALLLTLRTALDARDAVGDRWGALRNAARERAATARATRRRTPTASPPGSAAGSPLPSRPGPLPAARD
ncbi:MFS transporter [Actinomadura kijaniata]|uniref:MFS transporter n=1 Tax=Actinomadura kijaniata TaxID=46161 RepID=UPI00082B4461|nr:MFS transporter [Actinomadura kijaniata]